MSRPCRVGYDIVYQDHSLLFDCQVRQETWRILAYDSLTLYLILAGQGMACRCVTKGSWPSHYYSVSIAVVKLEVEIRNWA
jgi:hypothetical protein